MSHDRPPAAGWFPDPLDPARQRYWDGAAWTEHVQGPAAPVAGGSASSQPGQGEAAGRRRLALTAGAALVGLLLIGAVVVLATRSSDSDTADANRAAAEVTTTVEASAADTAEVKARYDEAVATSCAQLKLDITAEMLQPPLDYRWSDDFGEVLGLSRSEMVGAIRACAQPAVDEAKAQQEAVAAAAAEQERLEAEAAAAAEQAALESAPAIDVDAVVKNPDAGKGTIYRLVAVVTQMDAATGPCNFRGYWDNSVRAYNFEYQGDNAMFTAEPDVSPSTTCPVFDGIDQDDTMTLTVRLQGSLSYDTQIGGNTTVPHFQVLRVDKLVKG